MSTVLEAIYENGVLKPLSTAGLKERRKYKISLEEEETEEAAEEWLSAPLPELGNIVFNEDPSLPLDSDDWPDESDESPN